MVAQYTDGGVQYVPQIAVVQQIIYLDFDGELTSYQGELLTVENVAVQKASLTEERIAGIVSSLNGMYASSGIKFVTERPQEQEYSTIYIGKTTSFAQYGSFAGLAETLDEGNLNKSDNAFVLLDSSNSDSEIIATISHEADHITGRLDHGGSGLNAYGYHTPIYSSAVNLRLSNGKSATVYSGGTATNTTVNSGGYLYVSSGGTATNTTVNYGGYLYVFSGGTATNTILNHYGYLRIFSGGTATNTTVNSGGYLYVSSDGTATNTTVNSGGSLYVYSGGTATNTILNYYGYLCVSSGGTATNTTVKSGGDLYVSSGGVATKNTVNGDLYVSSGGVANNTTVNSWGDLYVFSGGTAIDTIMNTGGRLYISSGGIHRGSLQIQYGFAHADAGSIIDFTLADRSTESDYLINDLSLISGAPTYTITVCSSQASGTYKLAQGAGDFTGVITIGDDSVEYGKITVNGEMFKYNEIQYRLTLENGDLKLLIGDDFTPPELTITGIPAAWTNQDVVLKAEVNEENCTILYQINDGEWLIYTDGITISANCTVNFKATDRADNVTEKTVEVALIDKAVPAIPDESDKVIAKLDWADAVDSGGAGVKGYYIRYGTSEDLTGEGEFVTASEFNLPELSLSIYYYQLRIEDNAGNLSEWSEVYSCKIISSVVQNLQGSRDGMSWNSIPDVNGYIVEFSTDNFASFASFETSGNQVDIVALPSGVFQWRVRAIDEEVVSNGNNITSLNSFEESEKFVSDADGTMDIFWAAPQEKWKTGYVALHSGLLDGWEGTGERVALSGKNKLVDIFEGSTDANILFLTDDENGDALFVDDIFTSLPGPLAEQQARITQISEIRAGAGDDIVDLTSRRFAYEGNGVTIYGGSGDDTIWANRGNNTLYGDAGNDKLVGGTDNDIIIGGSGDDSMHGGGGEDIFTFCTNWGNDTVEQLEGSSVTLWFESGSEANWNAETLTYTDGANSVTVTGVGADKVTLNFGTAPALAAEAFSTAASEKIFDENSGLIA